VREGNSVLTGGGMVAGGPVGVWVGATVGAVAGALGGAAVGTTVNAEAASSADTAPADALRLPIEDSGGTGQRTHWSVTHSQLATMSGAPHGLNVSHTQAFNDALLSFLRT
jgi:hypothetical protein